jgi:hypothetical protein
MATGFEQLDSVCSGDARGWLEETAPNYAEAVKAAIRAGKSPKEIYHRMLARLGPSRRALAKRCELAAEDYNLEG